jgi:hypothetical protein
LLDIPRVVAVEQELAVQSNDSRLLRRVVGELKCQGDIVVLVRVQHPADVGLPRMSPRSAPPTPPS